MRPRVLSALALIGVLLTPLQPASALTDLPVTATIANASPAASTGDTVDIKVSGVTTGAGATTQDLAGTWDPKNATLNADPVAPQNWALEYLDVRSNTWSATKPPVASIGGVRANGPVNSLGTDEQSRQIGRGDATAGPVQQVKSITVTGAGDGYDVFFDEDHTQIYNVFHHSSPSKIDCHLLSDGSRCSGFPVALPNSLGTNQRSTGIVIGTKVYIPAGYGTVVGGGFACVNTTGGLCSTPFYKLSANVSTLGYDNVFNVTRYGSKIYTQNKLDGRVLCLDTATDSACDTMPTGGYDVGLSTTSILKSNLLVSGSKLYVHSSGLVGCLEPTTGTVCAGWETLWNPAPDFGIAQLPDASGQIIALCTYNDSSAECIHPVTRAAVTAPASYITALSQAPVRSGLGGYPNTPATSGSRIYWADSSWDRVGKIQCWDASLNAGSGGTCANFPLADENYTVVVDPTNANCIWTNDNSGSIEAFNATTGASGCSTPTTVITFNGSAVAPRLSCNEPGRIVAWRAFVLADVAGGTYSAATLTVKNSTGSVIAGWSDIAIVEGRVDLSGLSVADTGTNPKFVVSFTGEGADTITSAGAGTEYISGVPELCIQIVVLQDCPVITGHGASTDTSWARDPFTVSAAGNTTIAGEPTTATGTVTVERTAATGCLGGITGKALVSATNSNLEGVTVNLLDVDSVTVLATTTTAVDGTYTFENYIPGEYALSFGTVANLSYSGASVTTALVPFGANATVKASYAYGLPTASDVVSNGPPATAQVVDPYASVRSAGGLTVESSTMQLLDPSNNTWTNTVTIDKEGAYVVNPSDHKVTFTPVADFLGTATPVAYRITDSIGQRASANIAVTVAVPVAPAPAPRDPIIPITTTPIAGTDLQGRTQSFKPVAVAKPGTNAVVVPATVRLIENGDLKSSIIVEGQGTWSVDNATGDVTFTPLASFFGVATPISYRIGDSNGTATISTITATVTRTPETKFSVSAGVATTPVDITTTVDISGVPAGSTVTFPSGIRGVSSATYNSGSITVVPAAGFSGLISLPVAVTLNERTENTVATVTVYPAPAVSGTFSKVSGGTQIKWVASPTPSVTGYRVFIDGKLVCESVTTTCTIEQSFSSSLKVLVRAIGGDAIASVDMTPTPVAVAATCTTLGAVYFDTAKWVLTSQSKSTLDRVAATIAAKGSSQACIVGHTDNRGSFAYNDKLSRNRVNAVYAYLAKKLPGVVFKKSFDGERKPTAVNDAPSNGMAKNRRVEIAIG